VFLSQWGEFEALQRVEAVQTISGFLTRRLQAAFSGWLLRSSSTRDPERLLNVTGRILTGARNGTGYRKTLQQQPHAEAKIHPSASP